MKPLRFTLYVSRVFYMRNAIMSFVPIIMGSRADLEHAQVIAAELKAFGIASELRVASAHKAARYLLDLLAGYEADPRPKVYITVAGRSNALSGMVDANVAAPVIACPPYSDRFGGADLFSSLRMPSGVAPAVVLEPNRRGQPCWPPKSWPWPTQFYVSGLFKRIKRPLSKSLATMKRSKSRDWRIEIRD
jgi:5-(carboxyamino)imidazole ribonucleotide mutase/phosphoribosylaminoimidazole-succinocarboxamide synthase